MEYTATQFLHIDIQCLAEGGDGGTGAEGAATGVTADAADQQQGVKPTVIYGKQTEAAAQTDEEKPADRNAEFVKLIKGDYKDLFDAKVQSIVGRRLKGSEEKTKAYDAAAPLIERLHEKYGTKDIEALINAYDNDDSNYEAAAMEKGYTVEQAREISRITRDNERLRAQVQQREAQEQADRIYSQWLSEADKVKALYPDFDLRGELANDQFKALLQSNIPVQTAYEVCHKDEIITRGMAFAAQSTAQKIANDIQSRGKRPGEGGLSGQSTVITKSDVSQLTKEDRREIERRVRRGERISF